ncbi:MAG: DUF2141 domain-containing protein [Planctomycetales bacterium]|nr:DUF2141 domain-containing protein [Planctomycetales bacterium]
MRPLHDKIPISLEEKKGRFKRAWNESHGYALLGFAAVIFMIGMLLIWTSPPRDSELEIDLSQNKTSQDEIELPPDTLVIRVATTQVTSEGPIRIAIYDSKETFGIPSKAIIKDTIKPVEGFVAWAIKLEFLPESFAVAAYHDLDDNGELNRALFNAPVEPYGFSNNARSLVGPPTYEQTIMQRPTVSTIIEIRVY